MVSPCKVASPVHAKYTSLSKNQVSSNTKATAERLLDSMQEMGVPLSELGFC